MINARAVAHGRNRAKFWANFDYINTKLAGQARRKRKPHLYLTIRVTEAEKLAMEYLAAEASEHEQRWITTHEYHRRLIREHLKQQAQRLEWKREHETK